LLNTLPDKEWTWTDIAERLKPVSSLYYFREIILASQLYPNRIRVVGSGRINYDPNVSDYVLPMPTMAFQAEINAELGLE
jgi:hypothetical protein